MFGTGFGDCPPFPPLTNSSRGPRGAVTPTPHAEEGKGATPACPGAGSQLSHQARALGAPPAPSPFCDLRELHPGQELVVLADLPDGSFELAPVLVDQPPPLLLLLAAALFSSKLEADGRKPGEMGKSHWPRLLARATVPHGLRPAARSAGDTGGTGGALGRGCTHTLTSRGVKSFSGTGLLFSQVSGWYCLSWVSTSVRML